MSWSVVLRRFRSVLALAAICLGGAAGCGSQSASDSGHAPAGGGKRIILLTNGNSPYWDAAAAGARTAAGDLKVEEAGLTVVIDRNDFKVEGQIGKLKQYASSGDVVAVGVSVTDANNRALANEMKRLRDAGIHVIAIDSDVDRQTSREARFAYLGTDNVIAGRELGKAAAGLLPEGGQYATFVGLKGAANAVERMSGFAEAAGAKFEQIESLGDGGEPAAAKRNVEDALDRHRDLDLLVGIWSYNTPAAVDVVKARNVADKVKIVGFDADPPTIRALGEQRVEAIVVQNPYEMGYQGVRLLKALVEDDKASIDEMFPNLDAENGDLYNTGLKVVVPTDDSPLKADLFDEQTEFLTLEQFKAWLSQHGLTGS